MKQKTKENGITLIALVITIIVMLILVAVSVNIATNGGIFENARKAAFQTDVAKYKEELQAYLVTNYENNEDIRSGNFCYGDSQTLTNYIKSYNYNKYGDSFVIDHNELVYVYIGNEKEVEWAKECGVESQYTYPKVTINIDGEGKVKVTGEIKDSPESKEGKTEIECTEETEFTATAYKKYELTATGGTKNINGNDVEFVFSRWLKDGKTISTNATETITVTGDVTYTAVFEPSETLIYYNENDVFVTAETTINASTYSGTITDKTSIKKVLFGNKVTAIGNSAFSGCTGLTKVSFGNSIETIGKDTFQGCTGITGEITIPDKVTELKGSTFEKCTEITKIDLNNVETIKWADLGQCTNLLTVIGKKVKNINRQALAYSNNIKNIELGSVGCGVTSNGGFDYSGSLDKATIKIYIDTQGGTVKSLTDSVPSKATIEYYDASTGELVNVILGLKYQGNTEITWDQIPNKDKMTEIRGGAFSNCTGITGEITIPDKVTKLSGGTFYGCTGITKVNLNNVETMSSDFSKCTNLYTVVAQNIKTAAGFEYCKALTNVEFGSKGNPVITIDRNCFFDYLAFNNNMTIKIYIDTQEGQVTSLNGATWGGGASKATIEYYDAETGNKIN